jgi:hypothetical protein
MKSNLSIFYGIVLIVIGAILLLPQVIDTRWNADEFSLVSVSLIGLFMVISYFLSNRKYFFLVLFGTLFFFLGLIFLYSIINGWSVWQYIAPSPLYLLAVSFFLTYLADKRHPQGFYIAAIVLGIVSLSIFIILSIIFNKALFTSVALIISGILLPFASLIKTKQSKAGPR